jgi:hypothetical protein
MDLANGTFDMELLAVVKHTKVIEPVKQPSVVKKTKKGDEVKKKKTIANKWNKQQKSKKKG